MPDYQFDFIFQPLEADHSNLVKIGQCSSSLRHLRVAMQFVNLRLLVFFPPNLFAKQILILSCFDSYRHTWMRTVYLRIDSSFQKVPSPNSKILGRAPQNTCHDLGLLSHLLQKWLNSFPALGNVGVTWHWAPRALMKHEGEEAQPRAGQSTLPASI